MFGGMLLESLLLRLLLEELMVCLLLDGGMGWDAAVQMYAAVAGCGWTLFHFGCVCWSVGLLLHCLMLLDACQ